MSAAYYFNKSLLHKQQKDFAEFYKSSLLYLAFISSDALPQDVKLVSPASPRFTCLRIYRGLPRTSKACELQWMMGQRHVPKFCLQ